MNPNGIYILKAQKMGPTGCPATPVRNYDYSLRNNPEKRSSQRYVVGMALRGWRHTVANIQQADK